MAEGRMLKKAITTSRKLAELKSDSARLLYTWLLPHLDIEGRFSADPAVVKGAIFPRLRHSIPRVGELLEELHAAALIIIYEADGDDFLQFVKFKDHQHLRENRESKSKIPPPPKSSRTTPGELPEDSRSTPAQVKLREVKLREDKTKKTASSSAPSAARSKPPTAAINFNFSSKKWENISKEDKALWAEAYPACEIEQELLAMADWLVSNPTKKKKNYRRFITNWLSREQDRGGSIRVSGRIKEGKRLTKSEERKRDRDDWAHERGRWKKK